MDYRKSYRIQILGVTGGCAIALVGAILDNSIGNVLCGLGFLILIGAGIQGRLFCVCPYCGEPLNIRSGFPKYCKDCGRKLEE